MNDPGPRALDRCRESMRNVPPNQRKLFTEEAQIYTVSLISGDDRYYSSTVKRWYNFVSLLEKAYRLKVL